MHYWLGSINKPELYYKNEHKFFFILIDNIKLVNDLQNEIPDKSWMLYLLEIFNSQHIPIELNLISQFDGQNYFEAIFNGYNKYRFTKVIPQIDHTYQRKIEFLPFNEAVLYELTDLNNNMNEKFLFSLDNTFSFRFYQFFTGIEWWNKIDFKPYHIRFEVEISNMMYGINDKPEDKDSIIFFPIDSLFSNKDNLWSLYPVSFFNICVKNGCLSYRVKNGKTKNGPIMDLDF